MASSYRARNARALTPRWSVKIAVISLALLVSAIVLHRLFSIPTPVALNLFKLSILGGILSIVLAAFSLARLWSRGGEGAGGTFTGLLLGIGLIGWPLAALPEQERLPAINDITTDTSTPPPFHQLASLRAPGANDPAYPGASFASLQEEAYPDLKPLFVNRSVGEAFEICSEAFRRLGYVRVAEEPPGTSYPATGLIEAFDRTLVWGFYDDVVCRVAGNAQTAQVDLRSASRYGRHDFGRNAERLRATLREIVARLEATVSREKATPAARQPAGEPARRRGEDVRRPR
ncbi:MAG: DUF1499 domain-containing protein [Hyphomicrobiaceae bacterium]|nr:DUF1499 domain-containing protein [Hyphomicrobiaceae bacterium]